MFVSPIINVPVEGQADITANAFWWGDNIVFPEPVMKTLNTVGDIAKALGPLLASAAAAAEFLLPFIPLIIGYVVADFAIMKAIDQGKGVYLSATWLAPPLLIPTPIT